MEYYTEFDYRKILATLKQIESYVDKNSQDKYYLLSIQTFEDKNSKCIDLTCLEEADHISFFENPENFSLIEANFFIDKQGPVLSMFVGEKICSIKSEYNFSLSEKEDFKGIIPELLNREEIENDSYRKALSIFYNGIWLIVTSNIQIEAILD